MIKNLHLTRWWFKPILPLLILFTWLGAGAQTFNFTNAGASGRLGPTQAQINSSYSATALNGKVTSNNGIQAWTVPANGKYTITAKGAQGAANGGKGATLSGEFNLLQGHVINIVVGQIGTGSGGAGGSFIFDATSSTLLMAAGGGGGGADNVNTQGQITTSASGGFATGVYNNNFAGKGGINGGGGGAGSASDNSTSGGNGGNGADGGNTVGISSNAGAGGAGFLGKGGNSASNAVQGGEKWANGMLGGIGPGNGGFGGGGASSSGLGGGGGYSGGGGGGWTGDWNGAYGGGGGSFNGGSNQVNSRGTNPGDGSVTIDQIAGPNALSFSGPIDRVDVPTLATVSGSFTVEAWVKPEDLSDMVIFSSRINNGNAFDIQFNSNGFHGDIGYGANWLTTNADAPFARVPGRWLHVAYVVTPTGYTIYGNGEIIGSGSYSGPAPLLFNSGTDFQIGYNAYNQFTKGSIDELKIYNAALTQANVQADMLSTTASVPGNLVAYYSFDQGNPGGNNAGITTLNNDAGANYNGTLYNFALNGTSSNWVGSYAMIVPTSVAATPITNTAFTAKWTAPAAGIVNKYYLDVATDANFTSFVTGYNNRDVGNVLLYNITGLNPATNYFYRVRAYNTALNAQGASSKTIQVTTLKTDQVITFAATDSKIYGNIDFTAGATSNNVSLPITYASSDPTVATVTSGVVHILKAGTTTITASQAGDGTYNAAVNKQQVLTILPKAITVTATTGQTKVYTNADPLFTYTLSAPLVGSDVFTGVLGRTAGERVGSYAINQNTLVLSGSYSLTFVAANFTITPRALLVTTAGVNKVYDGLTGATLTLSDNRLAGDAFTIGYTANFDTKDVGIGKPVDVTGIVLTGTDALNYTPNLTATTTADVTPKIITINATAGQTKVYGDADPVFIYTTSSPLFTGDGFTGALSRVAGNNIGSYMINQGSLTAGTNYALIYVGNNFSITKKPMTVIADAQSKTYGDADPAFTYTLSTPLIGGDVFTGTLNRVAGENIGAYTINQNTLALNANYTLSYTSNNLSIGKRALLIAAAGINKIYDGNTNATVSLTDNRVTGDVLTTNYATATFADKNVGTVKPVSVSGITLGGAAAANYTFNTTTSTTADITTKTLMVNATGINKVYDGTTNATVTLTDNRLSGDVLTATYVTAAFVDPNAGTAKPVSVSGISITGTDASNYSVNATVNTTANITAKSVTVIADAQSKTYGNADPAFTYTLSTPLISGDVFTGALNRVAGENVGTYTINQNTLALNANYTLSYTSNNLSIGKRALLIAATGINKIYDGNTNATVSLTDNRVTGDVLTTNYATATFADKNVGTVKPVSVSGITLGGAAATNYTFNTTTSTTANITTKTLMVNATGINKVYDGTTNATVTLTDNRLSGDVLTATYVTAAFADPNAGTAKPVSVSGISITGTDASNYSVNATVNTTANITAKSVTVIADAQSKTYGDADPVFTYTLSTPLISGDVFTGALNRVAGENVGAYAINKGSLALSNNYNMGYTTANLLINKKALTITADNKSRLQGAVNPVFTASYTGFIAGDNSTSLTVQPVFTTTANTGSLPGAYPITVNTAASNNYTITFNNGILTVQASVITDVILTAIPLYENNAANTPAGTLNTVANDPAGTYTYTLVSGTGSDDNAKFNLSGNTVRATAALDFETQSLFNIRVRATSQFGVSFERSLSINLLDVNEVPTLAAINNQSICYTSVAQTVSLSGITAGPETTQATTISVSSNNPALFESLAVTKAGTAGTLTYRVKAGAAGTATVTVTVKDNGGTANGGVDTFVRTFTITVFELPVITINSDKGTDVSKGETIKLTATGGVSYVWKADNSILAGQNTAVLTVRPSVNTTYTVTVTNANGCVQTSSFTINVASDFAKLKITNLLTPNGDGFNDKWVIENIDLYPNNEVKVFDKAGRIVYAKKAYDNSWDGSFNGTPLKENTYYYIVDFGPGFGKLKGFITIVREQ
ncbi:MBG domain-containing protein [Pedobacter nototheniae]|uniref:MBG domain-containing protein n=1 Tax=Pedobacter nototheniae TaxID=2488994 RepID=UPI00292D4956|nr:MBG domain-containing protein [Pedobacter nototheniae]